jgi:hypothetical protein
MPRLLLSKKWTLEILEQAIKRKTETDKKVTKILKL